MSPRGAAARGLAATMIWAAAAAAQAPLQPGQDTMPPGHPPVEDPAPDAPETTPTTAEAPDDGDGALPPGHPPMAQGAAHGAPTGHGAAGSPPADRVTAAPELPAGTVEVTVVDGRRTPQPGVEVVVAEHRHDVAEGDSVKQHRAKTDADGGARLSGLPTETSYSYTVELRQGPAMYRSEEFQLRDGLGRRVLQHVFPVERDIRRAMVGMRGIVFVEPREDKLQVEMSFQVFNIGQSTWVPEGLSFRLPSGAEAFRARESEGDTTFEDAGGEIRIVGTYPPGQQEIGLSFQLPATGEARQAFDLNLPPHVAELRVASSIGRAATLSVDGFPEAQHVRGQDGSWMAMTAKQLARGQEPLSRLAIELDGLRSPSQGRWVAVGLAGVIMAAGLASAFGRKRTDRRGTGGDAEQAAELLFEELAVLDQLRAHDEIGPRAYERARHSLIDALARVEAFRRAATLPERPART